MAKVEYIKCDICGRKIDNHFNITQVCNEYGIEGLRFYFGKLFVSDFLKWPAFDLTDCLSIAHFSVRQRFNDTGATRFSISRIRMIFSTERLGTSLRSWIASWTSSL